MQTLKILAALVLVGGLVLTACTSNNSPSISLNDTSWILVTLNGKPVLPETPVTLNFTDGKINGKDGCNSYGGSYTLDGDQFKVGKDIISTMMACAEPIMKQASEYITMLTQAAKYKVDGSQLTLLDASGKTLAALAAQSKELGGTAWIVTGYNNGKQAVVSVLSGSELTANFGADGKLSGSAGCNNYFAAYEVSGKSIKIGPAASTKKMCNNPVGVMEQEMQFLKALETAATYRIDGNRLELRTTDGALAVTLKKAG